MNSQVTVQSMAGTAHDAEIDRLRYRIADLENALRQRQEETGQAWSDVEAKRAQAETLRDELEQQRGQTDRLTAKLAESEGWVFRLAGERQQAERDIAAMSKALAREQRMHGKAAATLGLRDEEITKLRVAAEAPRAAEAVDALTAELAAMERAHQTARAKAQDAIAAAERAAIAAREDAKKARERALKAENARDEAARRLTERFSEIATITALLHERENTASADTLQTDWLRDVAAVVLEAARARPKGLRPALPWTRPAPRWTEALRQRGLFDAGAYLTENPDVASTGLDPLLHYLTHGIAEGRRCGPPMPASEA